MMDAPFARDQILQESDPWYLLLPGKDFLESILK